MNADGQEIRYDASNTYSVSADDYQVLGHNSPDWTMGFQNTLTYKDFDLSIYMYMRWGQMIKYSAPSLDDSLKLYPGGQHRTGWRRR